MKSAASHLRIGLIALVIFTSTCIAQAQITITFQLTPACNSSNPGRVCAVAAGGTSPYQYDWSNGVNQACINAYPGNWPATYVVTATDAAGATASASVPINNANPGSVVSVQVGIQHETCSDNDGMAWIKSISGGTPPYTICWHDRQSNCFSSDDTVFNLSADDYISLDVVDANGCIGIDTALGIDSTGWSIWVDIEKNLPYTYTITSGNEDCGVLGFADVDATGGVAPITYQWNTSPPQFTDSVGLHAGHYWVTISDGTPGCSVTEWVFIRNLNPIYGSVTSTKEVCDDRNGSATVVPTTGVAPYTYAWDTLFGQNTSTITGLASGVYNVTFVDANQCSGKAAVYVGNTSAVQPNAVGVDEVCNDSSGSITLHPMLGTPPYTYQWSTGDTTVSISNLQEGYYTFTVTDAQGCGATGGKSIQDVTSYTVTLTYTPATCLTPGTATANVTGTSGPYTYAWSTNPVQTTQTATGLSQGGYQCTISDANNCTTVDYVYIQYDPLVSAVLTSTAALCTSSSGSISMVVSGGLPPYTFQWSNNDTVQNITGVPFGNYTVTITDANGCSVQKSKQVLRSGNIGLSISTVDASCIFTSDGQATANVTNAAPPITYRWGNGQTTQTATGLQGGWRYGVVVTDSNGCLAFKSASIGYSSTSCAEEVTGKVLHDVDASCSITAGDIGMLNIPVRLVPGYYDLTDANGDYSFLVPSRDYALNHVPPYHMFQLCPLGTVELFGMASGTDTIVNFYDTLRTAFDLRVGLCYVTHPRPGYTHLVTLDCANLGNLAANAIVEYDYDTLVSFVSSSHVVLSHDAVNRKISFSLNNFVAGDRTWIDMNFSTPTNAVLGTQIKECSTILPVVNDVNFTNNTQCDSTIVVGSFDPNDKSVSPQGAKVSGHNGFYITREDSVLHYKIRFQNTGTYAAEHVAILDTLDEDLDISSIHGIMASHPYRADFFMNKYFAFYFDNINLPDSFRNEPESHGYASFFIKLKSGLPAGTEINNRAAIYFDYNEPVITNTVSLVLAEPLGIASPDDNGLAAFPNPTENKLFFRLKNTSDIIRQVEILDLSGKQCAISRKAEISLEKMPSGMYFYRVLTATGSMLSGKVVKKE